MSCGQHWNACTLKGPAFKRTEGQCANPSTTCQIQQILQSSHSLHLKARSIEGHNCAQCYHWASWTAAGMHLHCRHPEKWVMQFSSNLKERCSFFLFLLEKRLRGVRLWARTWQSTAATCEPFSCYERSITDVWKNGKNGIFCHTKVPKVPL